MKTYIVLGATSAIAQACCRVWAERGARLLLVARSASTLADIASDLQVRSSVQDTVLTHEMDLTDTARYAQLVARAKDLGTIDGVLIAHGMLPTQASCETDTKSLRTAIEVNGTSALIAMAEFARILGPGSVLAVIGSVAGDRGRASNYTYGAAKAMVATYAAGLRHRLHAAGVRVLTIKPGFVDTPMTAAFDRKGLLWASPEDVARVIVRAMDARQGTIYVPWFWRWIMLIIRLLPESLFVKTRL